MKNIWKQKVPRHLKLLQKMHSFLVSLELYALSEAILNWMSYFVKRI